MMPVRRLLIAILLGVSGPSALAQDTAATEPVEPVEQTQQAEQAEQATPQAVDIAVDRPGLTVRELFIIQADRYDTTANNPKLITTTLFQPIKHTGRAKRRDATGEGYEFSPMPLGLITFSGQMDEQVRVKLKLTSGTGQVHAHWPSNGITGPQLIDWPELSAADETDRVMPIKQESDWLAPLREGEDRLWFQSRKGQFKERFLLYDASFSFKPAIKLEAANDQYVLKTDMPERSAPPVSVLVRGTDAGWSADALAAPWATTTSAIASKTPGSAPPSLHDALAPIKDLLTQRGYNAKEIELALSMIASAGFESASFSLVYVLPTGVIDEHIPLKIEPAPDQLIRTAIVVLNNVDPDLGSRINALIDDLGSDQWLTRERAQRELLSRGKAAIKKLQQLKNHEDPEVAFRAQQILDDYDWQYNGGE